MVSGVLIPTVALHPSYQFLLELQTFPRLQFLLPSQSLHHSDQLREYSHKAMRHLIIVQQGSLRAIDTEIHLDLSKLADEAKLVTHHCLPVQLEEREVLLGQGTEHVETFLCGKGTPQGGKTDGLCIVGSERWPEWGGVVFDRYFRTIWICLWGGVLVRCFVIVNLNTIAHVVFEKEFIKKKYSCTQFRMIR
jgi:hypothetical protein